MNDALVTALIHRPRRDNGACSMTYDAAEVYSAPIEIPCTKRQQTRMIGAAIPIDEYVGINPMAAVPIAINSTIVERVFFRPIRSPILPNIAAPSGRTANATPYTANAESSAVIRFSLGKNTVAMAVAAYP